MLNELIEKFCNGEIDLERICIGNTPRGDGIIALTEVCYKDEIFIMHSEHDPESFKPLYVQAYSVGSSYDPYNSYRVELTEDQEYIINERLTKECAKAYVNKSI